MNAKRFIIISIIAVMLVATLSGCGNGAESEESSAVLSEPPAIASSADGTLTQTSSPPPSEQSTMPLEPLPPSAPILEATEDGIYAAALAEFTKDAMELTTSVLVDLDGDGTKEMVAFTGTDNAGYAIPVSGSNGKGAGNEARLVIFSADQGEIQIHRVSDNYAYTLANSTNYRLYISSANYLVLEQTGHDCYDVYVYKLENGELLEARLGYGQSSAWFTEFDGIEYYNKEEYTYPNREFGELLRSKMLEYGIQSISASIKDWSEKRISSVYGNTDASSHSEEYIKSKIEFENAVEFAVQKTISYAHYVRGIEPGYYWEIIQSFEEMLQYRQSLEDVNEEMGHNFSELYDFRVAVEIKAAFTDGNTDYRLVLFSSWGIPVDRMYIQIYDDQYYEYRSIKQYQHEGGTYEIPLFCSFIQDSDKIYLAVIEKKYNEPVDTFEYYLINYETDGDGKEFISYNALKAEISKGIWTVSSAFIDYPNLASTRISFSDKAFLPERWWELDYNAMESFEENILTITLNNDARDSISLQFVKGFWEIIS